MKEIANKNGVPNQEHHGFKVLADWQREHLSTRQFEACTRRDMYACVLCRARPIEGGAEITSKVPVPIESKGDGQKSPLSKIQRPYNFERAKINFLKEDLENSSEEDDWDSDGSLPVSSSP